MASEFETLKYARMAHGLSQIELAKRAGISRQALSAIESGAYQPGVSVALKLARELGLSVEELFGAQDKEGSRVFADYVPEPVGLRAAGEKGARVSLARVHGRLIAVPLPVACLTLVSASGLADRVPSGGRVEVTAFRSASEIDSTLVIVGCDPAVEILRNYMMRRRHPIEVISIPGSSRKALEMAAAGGAHVAGVHLRDPKTGEYNFTAAREAFGRSHFKVVQFARWELGLATRAGKRSLGDIENLTKRRLRLINREPGSGARVALDEAFALRGIKAETIHGYHKLASGHLEVAAAIAAGVADAGVTIRLAANLYNLEFRSWREERYDLIVADDEFKSAPVQSLMEALNARALAQEINGLCAYDTSQMGDLVTAEPDRTT